MSSVARVEGLEQYELAALVAVAQQIDHTDDGVSTYIVRQDMEKAGFTNLATTLGLKALRDKAMLSAFVDHDHNGNEFTAYRVTGKGMDWLFENQDKLTLKKEPTRSRYPMPPPPEDDIPF
jgi:hypothetical protein